MHHAGRRRRREQSLSPLPWRTVIVPRPKSTSLIRNRTSSERLNPAPYWRRAGNPYRPSVFLGTLAGPSSFAMTACVSSFESTTGIRVPVFFSFTLKRGFSTPQTCLKKNASALSACFWVEKGRRLVGLLDRSECDVPRRGEGAGGATESICSVFIINHRG